MRGQPRSGSVPVIRIKPNIIRIVAANQPQVKMASSISKLTANSMLLRKAENGYTISTIKNLIKKRNSKQKENKTQNLFTTNISLRTSYLNPLILPAWEGKFNFSLKKKEPKKLRRCNTETTIQPDLEITKAIDPIQSLNVACSGKGKQHKRLRGVTARGVPFNNYLTKREADRIELNKLKGMGLLETMQGWRCDYNRERKRKSKKLYAPCSYFKNSKTKDIVGKSIIEISNVKNAEPIVKARKHMSRSSARVNSVYQAKRSENMTNAKFVSNNNYGHNETWYSNKPAKIKKNCIHYRPETMEKMKIEPLRINKAFDVLKKQSTHLSPWHTPDDENENSLLSITSMEC